MKPAEKKLFDRLLEDERLPDPRWVAYIMATVKHETNNTFQPVEEAYWLSEAWRQANLRYYPAHGRGFVQITWHANYEKMSHRLGMPALASNYDIALDWDVAYEILVVGMLEGLFTGRDLDDFINDDYCDYHRARKIINGMDQHKLIARYANDYDEQIRALGTRFTNEPPTRKYDDCQSMTWEIGSAGPCVQIIQRALNKWNRGSPIGSLLVDGHFGNITERRVKAFQADNSLVNDGVVGPATWKALEPYL